jgi:hypothetical protein
VVRRQHLRLLHAQQLRLRQRALRLEPRPGGAFRRSAYWLICCALRAPVASSVRARCASAAAAASCASASATAARICACSAFTVSAAKRASNWPFFTTSPTFTRTSSSRSPLASVPMLASCQAAMLPLADSRRASVARCGCTSSTLSEGFGAVWAVGAAPVAALSSSAARTLRPSATAAASRPASSQGHRGW